MTLTLTIVKVNGRITAVKIFDACRDSR